MSFTDDKEILIEKSSFLLKKGFVLEKIDDTGLTYSNKKIIIRIGYGRYGDLSAINIRFKKKIGSFDVAWIAIVMDNYDLSDEKLERTLQLIEYLKENYKNLTNLRYCLGTEKKIHEYITVNHPQFAWMDKIPKRK